MALYKRGRRERNDVMREGKTERERTGKEREKME